MKKNWEKHAVWFGLSAILLLIDQVSKRWAQEILARQGTMGLLDGIVGFRYAENTGAAFSSLSGATVLLSVFSLVVCAAVAVYMLRNPRMPVRMKLPLSMILAGGLGNAIDRICLGYVIDFIELQFVKFAIFNAADIWITSGAALLFIALLFGGEQSGRMDN